MGKKTANNGIRHLIAQGLGKRALEAAKKEFKRNPGPESREDLILAYLSRIEELEKRGDADSASTTREIVFNRFPECREEIVKLVRRQKVELGTPLDAALLMLLEVEADPNSCRAANDAIARVLVDPAELATSVLLADDHPLKLQAVLVREAFTAVTSNDKAVDSALLNEMKTAVDRQSPLASWRRAIMAIHAFHCGSIDSMKRHLVGINPEYPVSAVSSALNALVAKSDFPQEHPLANSFARLRGKMSITLDPDLRAHLDEIFRCANEQELPPMSFQTKKLFLAVRKRSETAFLNLARFWLHALAHFEDEFDRGDPLTFLDASGVPIEKSMIWLARGHSEESPINAASLLAHVALVAKTRKPFSFCQKGWLLYKAADMLVFACFPEVQYATGRRVSASELLELAKKNWPAAPIWPLRLEIMDLNGDSPTKVEAAVKRWHQEELENITPLLMLLRSARLKKTYNKALSFLNLAEKIDPIHPEIRNARTEILYFLLRERFANGKGKSKIPKEILALSKLLAAGDPRRFVIWTLGEAYKAFSGTGIENQFPEWEPKHLVLKVILSWLGQRWAGSKENLSLPPKCEDGPAFLRGFGDVCAGFLAVHDPVPVGKRISGLLLRLLLGEEVSDETLLPICETLRCHACWETLFFASGLGLAQSRVATYKYLFYRYWSLRETDSARALNVLRAAEFLAQKANDLAFIRREGENPLIRDEFAALELGFMKSFERMGCEPLAAKSELDQADVDQILQSETSAIWGVNPKRKRRGHRIKSEKGQGRQPSLFDL